MLKESMKMSLKTSTYSFVLVAVSCVCLIQRSNALSLLERINGLNGNEATTSATDTSTDSSSSSPDNYAENAEYAFTEEASLAAAHTCTTNSTALNNVSVLKEIRKVGATCRHHCGGDGGNKHSLELGDFSRKLQLLQISVEGLSLMLDEAMQRLEEPFAPTFLKSPYPKDCNEVQFRGETTSGVYTIHPEGCGPPFQVYCDMDTEDGAWTVFQRRHDGSVDFDKGWGSYRRGFGDLLGEFWLGNDKLHRLSFQDEYEILIELEHFNGTTAFAKYDKFWVGDVHANYRLHIGKYYDNGTAGDSLEYHAELPFTAIDKDNDLSYTNCAEIYSGAWWFNKCHYSNLNGRYLAADTEEFATGIVWFEFGGFHNSLKRSEMKIRSKT